MRYSAFDDHCEHNCAVSKVFFSLYTMDYLSEAGCSQDSTQKVTYRDLFEILRKRGSLKQSNVESKQFLLQKILDIYNTPLWDDAYNEIMNAKVLNFTTVLEKKWSENNESSSKSAGRPKINFNECAERTKINKVKHLVKSYSSTELSYAASANRNGTQYSSHWQVVPR
ncbi:hypothetical protein QTP88_015204 [Uroleucon formosanum]